MESRILFIDGNNSLIVRSVMEQLEKMDYPCIRTALSIQELQTVEDNVNELMVMNTDDSNDMDIAALYYLKQICKIKKYGLSLIGYGEDIEKLKARGFSDTISMIFMRPVNSAQVAIDIQDYICSKRKGNEKKNILIVDDSKTFLTTMKGWLSKDYDVTVAISAMEAFTLISRRIPDLILLDYQMPVCDGTQFYAMLKADATTARIPVMFLTGDAHKETVEKVMMLHPEGYILKTSARKTIREHIDRILRITD